MVKKYIITEESLMKLREFLGEIPHKFATPIEQFVFSDKVLEEIKDANKK